MKIMHVINGLGLGGTETALYRLLVAMQQSSDEHSFFVVVLGDADYYASKIEALGVPVYGLKKFKIGYLIALIRRIKPDVVQTWLYHSDVIGGVCAKLCGVKQIIWSIRCEGIGLKKTTYLIKKMGAMLSWIVPDWIVMNSKGAAQHHVLSGYCAKKIKVIYNGFDADLFFPNRTRRLGLGPTIGTLARFHKDKDYSNLIQAIDSVCESFPQVSFILCGKGCHDDNPELNRLLSKLIHRNKVKLINGVVDSAEYLNNLDIFVLPSRTESFPNSLAEAMLCGLPCIATDVGEVRAIMGEAGLLIPKENSPALAAACLVMLQKSKSEREPLGLLARHRIEQRYALADHIATMGALYHAS